MSAPYFYLPHYDPAEPELTLEEDASRHIAQVLRMKAGDNLQLTDGNGNLLIARIEEAHKKKCLVRVQHKTQIPRRKGRTTIAISLLKNIGRFEWFLEKATELGISEIIPMICERTEKQQFRFDRMKAILVSAMLQSQQTWLPELQEPQNFKSLTPSSGFSQKFIAHCTNDPKAYLADAVNNYMDSQIVLIGPEGDFTDKEIALALHHQYVPVSLGDTRLRSETAAIVAAVFLMMG